MEQFVSVQQVRLRSLLRYILPVYFTSLFNTVYTMVDGMFVSAYVGTDALAAINTAYPIVNLLSGIALMAASGGSAAAALHIGAGRKQDAARAFSASVLGGLLLGVLLALGLLAFLPRLLPLLGATASTMADCRVYASWWLWGAPVVIGKELCTYLIRADGAPGYSFAVALSGGVTNILLDYILVGRMQLGILGASAATVLGLALSCLVGLAYFVRKRQVLTLTLHGLRLQTAVRCLGNGTSELVDQLAAAVTTIVFNRAALRFAGEDGIAAVSIILYLQFLVIGISFGVSSGLAIPLGYAAGDRRWDVCRRLEQYARRFFLAAPPLLYLLTVLLAPLGVRCFAADGSPVFSLAVSGMRLYGLGFLFSGVNIFSAIRMTAYGKGHISGLITFLRSFALLLLFLTVLPQKLGIAGLWLAVPAAEALTVSVSVRFLKKTPEKLLSGA